MRISVILLLLITTFLSSCTLNQNENITYVENKLSQIINDKNNVIIIISDDACNTCYENFFSDMNNRSLAETKIGLVYISDSEKNFDSLKKFINKSIKTKNHSFYSIEDKNIELMNKILQESEPKDKLSKGFYEVHLNSNQDHIEKISILDY